MFEQYQGPVKLLFKLKRLLNMKEKKFAYVNSHDYHMLMTQLLLVALKGILPANIRAIIIKLCAFLNVVS